MKTTGSFLRRYFWKASGTVASLDLLGSGQGVIARHEVSALVQRPGEKIQRLTVVELADGRIIGDLKWVATRNEVVVGGIQAAFGCSHLENHPALKRCRFRFSKYRRGTALLLSAPNSDNYYHWLLESLPRWRMLQAAGILEYDWVLLPNWHSQFQEETLDRLGVPPEKRLRCSKNHTYQFERLIVPEMPFPLWEVAPWACAWISSIFPEKAAGPEKIYLSRQRASRRRLINEAALEHALAARGFTIIQPDYLTVAEQAKLLNSARYVVAPHGAALTNMVFAPPGANLLELFHPQYKNPCYLNLATACGHHYSSLDGEPASRSGAGKLDYTVDVSAVLGIFPFNAKLAG